MIGIVIVAHGGLAREYKLAVEHVVGKQENLIPIAIGPEDDRGIKQAEICAAADKVDQGDGVVVVTDMFGVTIEPVTIRLRSAGSKDPLWGKFAAFD